MVSKHGLCSCQLPFAEQNVSDLVNKLLLAFFCIKCTIYAMVLFDRGTTFSLLAVALSVLTKTISIAVGRIDFPFVGMTFYTTQRQPFCSSFLKKYIGLCSGCEVSKQHLKYLTSACLQLIFRNTQCAIVSLHYQPSQRRHALPLWESQS